MRTRAKWLLAGAGGLLAVGLVWGLGTMARPHQPRATRPRPVHPHPPSPAGHPRKGKTQKTLPPVTQLPVPTLPAPGAAAGSATVAGATAAFQAVTHTAPPVPVEVVPSPATPGHWWAIEPMGVTTPGLSAPTLWSAYRSSTGRWHWTPTTWPARIQIPSIALQDALQWADDLHQGMPGPRLLGPVPWSSVAGEVGPPAGWTMTPLPAADSPLGHRSVLLAIWMPSMLHPHVYYGLETVWDKANAFSGSDAIWMIQPAQGPLSQILTAQG